ncbi:hypothetical protein CO657_13655 [Rhizobium acidisoli]|uniref:Uncharacterized protein n=1 Tax=Rhizobium acidisoli TaxID=1538158 RepID=A0AAE5TWB9_9HYPH|nr:hypothetical protein [Rhizobium acidisoli]KPH08842.1 hypothetical protein AOG23_09995 [Rhizobium acidisoli]QAS79047.1 hypothetical protein CO657_13655 [Rhizobium acidisoli]
MTTEAPEKVPVSERFFAIDRNVWARVCDLGLNEAVSYVVIAAGTGKSHTVSNWSAEAIEKRTGMHHTRAKDAIGRLVEHGLMTVTPKGKLRRYDLNISEEPAFIWLPLSIVEGIAGQRSPLKLLRKAQCISAVRLFIDLYFFHDLAGNGGCEWRRGIGIRIPFERRSEGSQGCHNVWSFSPQLRPDGGIKIETWEQAEFVFPDIFQGFSILQRAGLIEFVEHLVDSDTREGEIIHPLPIGDKGEPGERAITRAACAAGWKMAPSWTPARPETVIVPVEAIAQNVQLIGIARLLFKPHVKQTKAWIAQSSEWANLACGFMDLASGIKRATNSGIKDISRKDQG